jgi:transcriptional regulator with XRE-family HTH domain
MKSKQREAIAAQFGRNLVRARKAAGLTQEELGIRAALHRTQIGLLERGERLPGLDTLVKLAASLSVSPLVLLDGIGWEPDRIQRGGFAIDNPRGRSGS